jgi:hypothetical protein
MLEAVVEGVEDEEGLTRLARGRLKANCQQLVVALEGMIGDHQVLFKQQIRYVEKLEDWIERLSEKIARPIRPFESHICAIDEVPGLRWRGAEEIVAETRIDMSRRPVRPPVRRRQRGCARTAARRLTRGPGTGRSARRRRQAASHRR